MIACGGSRGANGADDLTLAHSLICFNSALIQVQILCYVFLAVLYKDVVAVSFAVACFRYTAITCSKNGCSARRGIVGAAMRSCGFINWVHASRIEVRANASEVQRCH